MKRNTKVVDNDSDNEIWHYKSDRQLKYLKPIKREKKGKLSRYLLTFMDEVTGLDSG